MTSAIAVVIITIVLQFGFKRPIAKKSEIENAEPLKKIKYLQRVYSYLAIVITLILIALEAKANYSFFDVFNLLDGQDAFDIVLLLSNVGQTQNNHLTMLVFLVGIAMITPTLFLIAGLREKIETAGKLFIEFLVRAGMFLVGAVVAWISLIVLIRTPAEVLTDIPFISAVQQLLILLCLFINFRFQYMADREHEKNPGTFGSISMCSSAIWCAFVYAVFSIAFLLSLSTFLHSNPLVVEEGIYLFMGMDSRVYLLAASIIYGVLFIIESGGSFRTRSLWIFAAYAISAGLLFLHPMLFAQTGEHWTLVGTFIVFVPLFFLICWVLVYKFKRQVIKDEAEGKDESKDDEPTTHNKGKLDPWTVATLSTSVLIVLIAVAWPFFQTV